MNLWLYNGANPPQDLGGRGLTPLGKETNQWEEQFFLGFNPQEQIEYGANPLDKARALGRIRDAVKLHGLRAFARMAGISYQQLSAIVRGKAMPKRQTLSKLLRALNNINYICNIC